MTSKLSVKILYKGIISTEKFLQVLQEYVMSLMILLRI